MIGTQEMVIIFVVILLLFGASKLPELARSMGKATGEFKKAGLEYEKEINDMKNMVSIKEEEIMKKWWLILVSINEVKDWYNDRIHGSLELEWGETPNEAFVRKMQPESISGRFFKGFGW